MIASAERALECSLAYWLDHLEFKLTPEQIMTLFDKARIRLERDSVQAD